MEVLRKYLIEQQVRFMRQQNLAYMAENYDLVEACEYKLEALNDVWVYMKFKVPSEMRIQKDMTTGDISYRD